MSNYESTSRGQTTSLRDTYPIRSRNATPEYKDGWERTFGKKKRAPKPKKRGAK